MSDSDSEDAELLAAIRNDNEDALQRLLQKYYDRLCRFAFSMLHRRDLSHEAVDNVVLNFWRRRQTVAITVNLRSYLYGAVSYQAMNLFAKEKKSKHVPIDEVAPHSLPDIRSADTDLLYQELLLEIDELLSRMPPQRRLIFRLNRIEGLRYREIAVALGISERTVQNHMLLAIEYLSDAMNRFNNRHGESPRRNCETGR